jgi:hypothetical protein
MKEYLDIFLFRQRGKDGKKLFKNDWLFLMNFGIFLFGLYMVFNYGLGADTIPEKVLYSFLYALCLLTIWGIIAYMMYRATNSDVTDNAENSKSKSIGDVNIHHNTTTILIDNKKHFETHQTNNKTDISIDNSTQNSEYHTDNSTHYTDHSDRSTHNIDQSISRTTNIDNTCPLAEQPSEIAENKGETTDSENTKTDDLPRDDYKIKLSNEQVYFITEKYKFWEVQSLKKTGLRSIIKDSNEKHNFTLDQFTDMVKTADFSALLEKYGIRGDVEGQIYEFYQMLELGDTWLKKAATSFGSTPENCGKKKKKNDE